MVWLIAKLSWFCWTVICWVTIVHPSQVWRARGQFSNNPSVLTEENNTVLKMCLAGRHNSEVKSQLSMSWSPPFCIIPVLPQHQHRSLFFSLLLESFLFLATFLNFRFFLFNFVIYILISVYPLKKNDRLVQNYLSLLMKIIWRCESHDQEKYKIKLRHAWCLV